MTRICTGTAFWITVPIVTGTETFFAGFVVSLPEQDDRKIRAVNNTPEIAEKRITSLFTFLPFYNE
jgi:hypothetical protein